MSSNTTPSEHSSATPQSPIFSASSPPEDSKSLTSADFDEAMSGDGATSNAPKDQNASSETSSESLPKTGASPSQEEFQSGHTEQFRKVDPSKVRALNAVPLQVIEPSSEEPSDLIPISVLAERFKKPSSTRAKEESVEGRRKRIGENFANFVDRTLYEAIRNVSASYNPRTKKGESSSQVRTKAKAKKSVKPHKGPVPSVAKEGQTSKEPDTASVPSKPPRTSLRQAVDRAAKATEGRSRGAAKDEISIARIVELDEEEGEGPVPKAQTTPASQKGKSAAKGTRSYKRKAEDSGVKKTAGKKKKVVAELSSDSEDDVLISQIRKGKAVQVVDDSEEEGERKKKKKEKKRKISRVEDFKGRRLLKGRIFTDVIEPGMVELLAKLEVQGWKDLVLSLKGEVDEVAVQHFYINLIENADGSIHSIIQDQTIHFNEQELGNILGIPCAGFDDFAKGTWPLLTGYKSSLNIIRLLTRNEMEPIPRALEKGKLDCHHKLIFEFVNKVMMPRKEKRSLVTFLDATLVCMISEGHRVNWPGLMMKLMKHVALGKRPHAMPYGFLLTKVFRHFGLRLNVVKATKKEHFGKDTLVACDFKVQGGAGAAVPMARSSFARRMEEQLRLKDEEIAVLKARVARLEEDLKLERETNSKNILRLTALLDRGTGPSSSGPSAPKP